MGAQTTFSTSLTPTGVVLTPQQPIVQATVQPSLPDISHQDLQDILAIVNSANLSADDNMSDYGDLQNLEIVTSIGNLRNCLRQGQGKPVWEIIMLLLTNSRLHATEA